MAAGEQAHAILEPTDAVRDPFVFDASGLSLSAAALSPPEYRVRAVIPGSPASEVGILAGDRLLGINGAPATSRTLNAIRELLRQPGREFAIDVETAGKPRRVALVTRPLI